MGILAKKGSVCQGKSLQDFLKIYPMNFGIENKGEGSVLVTLLDTTCEEDATAASAFIRSQGNGGGKGKGKGKGKGMAFGMGGSGPGMKWGPLGNARMQRQQGTMQERMEMMRMMEQLQMMENMLDGGMMW